MRQKVKKSVAFGLMVGQNKQTEDSTVVSEKLWMLWFHNISYTKQLIEKTISRLPYILTHIKKLLCLLHRNVKQKWESYLSWSESRNTFSCKNWHNVTEVNSHHKHRVCYHCSPKQDSGMMFVCHKVVFCKCKHWNSVGSSWVPMWKSLWLQN